MKNDSKIMRKNKAYQISSERLQDDFDGQLNRYFKWIEAVNKLQGKNVYQLDCKFNKEKKVFDISIVIE